MRVKALLLSLLTLLLAGLGVAGAANARDGVDRHHGCRPYESWVGGDKVNIVDFTPTTGGASSPFRFRLRTNTITSEAGNGYFGPVAKGTMTFSYPRQNNPELPYVKDDPFPANFTHGPAFGEKVEFQARELGCNLFEVSWKETHKGDTVTHVQDFNRQQVCTNITNINRVAIPAGFDPFDINAQMNNPTLFADGGPVAKGSFGWFTLCGVMSQSHERDRIWENKLHYLVYVAS